MAWQSGQNVDSNEAEELVEEMEDRRRRSFRRGLWASFFGHVGLVVFFAVTPAPVARPLPAAVTIDLIAGIPKPAAAKRPAPAAAPAAAPKPTPKPAVKPMPPPPPKPTKKVLPKQPAPLKKQPRKVVKPTPRPKPEKLDYDDAMAKLRDDLGEPDAPPPEAEADAVQPETGGSEGGAGTPVSPETLRWINSVKRHVRSTYVTPPEFLNRSLETCMTVFLTADGRVMGDPSVTRSSGDIFWDDNSVRAMVRASPLPTPPGDGEWVICYTTEERE